MGVSTGGVPYHYGPNLHGNDPLLSLRLYSFILCVVSVLHSGTIALMWGGVMRWRLWLVNSGVRVGCAWDPPLYSDVYIIHSVGFFTLLSSCKRTQCRIWVHIPACDSV